MKFNLLFFCLFHISSSLHAVTCREPFRYDISAVAKLAVTGRVKIDEGKYFIIIEKSWFPIGKKIEIDPLKTEEHKLDPRSYVLDLKEGDWVFLMSSSEYKGKIYIPGCGKIVETVTNGNKKFISEKRKMEKKILDQVSKDLGFPKYFPNRR